MERRRTIILGLMVAAICGFWHMGAAVYQVMAWDQTHSPSGDTIIPAGDHAVMASKPPLVEILNRNGIFTLARNGQPYFIKGVGGNRHLASAAAAGANSVRTWDSNHAGEILTQATRWNMTVLLGVWLSHRAHDYTDPAYRQEKIEEVQMLLNRFKTIPPC